MKPEELLTVQPGWLNIVTSDFDARPMSYLSTDRHRTGYEPKLARLVLPLDSLNIARSI